MNWRVPSLSLNANNISAPPMTAFAYCGLVVGKLKVTLPTLRTVTLAGSKKVPFGGPVVS